MEDEKGKMTGGVRVIQVGWLSMEMEFGEMNIIKVSWDWGQPLALRGQTGQK